MNGKLIIQHLKNLFPKIDVHPLTLIYLIFAIIGGYVKWYLSALFIVCIHELCHLLMAYYFHFHIEKIEILPFGAYLSLNDFFFHSIKEEICVVLAGPSSHLFMGWVINTFIDGVYHDYLISINTAIFFFNLLPIYPLDGGRVIGLVLQNFIDLKKAMYFHLKISVFAFCCFAIFYIRTNTIVVISYLFIQQLYYYRFIPCYLRKYFSQIPTFSKERKIFIHHDLSYRRGYTNYYVCHEQILSEKEVMFDLIESVKK